MPAALLWAPAVLLAAALATLVAPVRLRLRAASGTGRVWLDLRLLGGWAPPIALVDTGRPRRAHAEPDAEPRTRRPCRGRERRGRRGRRPDAEMLRRLAGLLTEVPSAFRVTEARGKLALGLGDPAETGTAFGLLSGLACVAPGGGLALRPVFDRPCLEGAVDATLRIGTPRLLGIGLRAARLVLFRPGR